MAENELTENLELRTRLHSGALLSLSGDTRESADPSWYDYFATQLSSVIGRFGLQDQRDQVLMSFGLICKESLGIPHTCTPPNFSRINFDGIPLQYSLALGAFEPALQFIGEAGAPGSSNGARLKLSRERISSLLELLGIESFQLSELLDETVPAADPDLLSDHAGALWISPSFSPDQEPKLTIYINAKWGADNKRKHRLHRFASLLGAEVQWKKFEELANGEMAPLGAAVTLTADSRPIGRIYLSAFGKTVDYYASLARAMTTGPFDQLLRRYAGVTLGEDCNYPTQSAVCSIGLNSVGEPDFKFELCGHCAFTSDVDARSKCLDWLSFLNVDPTPYLILLDTLSENRLGSTGSPLHAYVGIGLKRGQPYSTIYLKPNPIRR